MNKIFPILDRDTPIIDRLRGQSAHKEVAGRLRIRERTNKERSKQCYSCRHYRHCVTHDRYCTPYSLMVRWIDSIHQTRRNEILEELKEAERHGFGGYGGFCVKCYYYRHAKCWFAETPCSAITYVMKYIPCSLAKTYERPPPMPQKRPMPLEGKRIILRKGPVRPSFREMPSSEPPTGKYAKHLYPRPPKTIRLDVDIDELIREANENDKNRT